MRPAVVTAIALIAIASADSIMDKLGPAGFALLTIPAFGLILLWQNKVARRRLRPWSGLDKDKSKEEK